MRLGLRGANGFNSAEKLENTQVCLGGYPVLAGTYSLAPIRRGPDPSADCRT